MRILQSVAAFALCTSATIGFSASAALAAPEASAPKQVVVVVAEGLSPQIIDLGSAYVKTSSTDPDTTIAFSNLKAQGKAATATGDAWSSMRGVLKTAAAHGYKTGVVTTGSVAADAALLYDVPTDGAASTLVKTTKADFLGGGGRSAFSADLTRSFKASGNTALLNADDFENADAVKGRVLALESDNNLSYALDRDSSVEAGVGDMASLAMKTLGGDNNTPYILVVHDTNIAKALAAKDTPALFGEFREVDAVIGDVLSTRSVLDKPDDMALAVVSTGAAMAPKYTSDVAADRSNAVFMTTQLNSSYSKATTTLKGATDEDVTTFATDTYIGWKPSADVRAKIIAGTMTGEDAVRASYESAIAIGYDATSVAPMAYVIGLDSGDVVKSVAAVASSKAK